MSVLEQLMAETDSTAFVAMVRSKPFQVLEAAMVERANKAHHRLAGIGNWDEACRLQGEIRAYQCLAAAVQDIEAHMKDKEKRG